MVDDDPASPRSSVASSEDGERCRVCYEVGGEGEMKLVKPCACCGSMEWIHKGCLLRWLMSSPAVVSRGCDVCDSAWREDLVKKPSLRRFVSELLLGSRGEIAVRRFLRHISKIPRFSDDVLNDEVFFEDGGLDEVDEVADDDEDEEDEIDERVGGVALRQQALGRLPQPPQQHNENGGMAFGLEDAWEAIGLLAPAGGGVEELNGAAAAIVRLAIWSGAMCVAVAQGRASLKLFAYGVRAVLVLDSRVDALLLPGSVADYLEVVFPGLPCLQRAARFGTRDERDEYSGVSPPAWRRLLRTLVGRSSSASRGRPLAFARRRPDDQPKRGLAPRAIAALTGIFGRNRQPDRTIPSLRTSTSVYWSMLCRLTYLARGPWRVDDVFVGFVALALDVRCLARFARSNRFFARQHPGLARQTLVALARIATSPEAVAHDIATVFEHLVSSPLLVVHWLCVFPSYVYALRLALARLGLLSADERVSCRLRLRVNRTFWFSGPRSRERRGRSISSLPACACRLGNNLPCSPCSFSALRIRRLDRRTCPSPPEGHVIPSDGKFSEIATFNEHLV